ncbi:unnamed protein product [Periconia digitata]|uniref:Uncharacterized protein n=1 Tax=Periconia digitata TaxID=1303443 RepID=A0A9W4UK72_9PLEO|nr:unnamed protein product [Periconia digitata]
MAYSKRPVWDEGFIHLRVACLGISVEFKTPVPNFVRSLMVLRRPPDPSKASPPAMFQSSSLRMTLRFVSESGTML